MNKLAKIFQQSFASGQSFKTITEARRFASSYLNEQIVSGTAEAKRLEEIIEAALVRVAKQIVLLNRGRSPAEIFDQLVDLYQRQPCLSTRSSKSVATQQYSTPLPLAYLVGMLARVNDKTTVWEPTAGHGALLITANPLAVYANELDEERANSLRSQGYPRVSRLDALRVNVRPLNVPGGIDRVLVNPPFGERTVTFGKGGVLVTNEQDHLIAWNALQTLNPDGRAVLILGSERTRLDEAKRSQKYNSLVNRNFFKRLYDEFVVEDHFTVDGELYRRQGAGFPVDVIVIAGRGKSTRPLPAAELPQVYRDWAELRGLLPESEDSHQFIMWLSGIQSERELRMVEAAGATHILLDPYGFKKLKTKIPDEMQVMLDSGAYPRFQGKAKPLSIDEYLAIAHSSFTNPSGHNPRQFSLIAGLDEIGQPEQTLANWNATKHLILPWVPVWQWGSDRTVLEQMLHESPVVGIGGLVKPLKVRDEAVLRELVSLCREFPRRFHLFGLCWVDAVNELQHYAYSADTSAWIAARSKEVIHVDADGRLTRSPAKRLKMTGSWEELCVESARNLIRFVRRNA